MRWVRTGSYGKHFQCHRVQQYPYFGIIVVQNWSYDKRLITYQHSSSDTLFYDLEEAKKDCLLHTRNRLLIDDFKWEVTYQQGVGSVWLCAGDMPWSFKSNSFAIRLPEDTSEEEALKIGNKIYKRHKNRFLREVNLYD